MIKAIIIKTTFRERRKPSKVNDENVVDNNKVYFNDVNANNCIVYLRDE